MWGMNDKKRISPKREICKVKTAKYEDQQKNPTTVKNKISVLALYISGQLWGRYEVWQKLEGKTFKIFPSHIVVASVFCMGWEMSKTSCKKNPALIIYRWHSDFPP